MPFIKRIFLDHGVKNVSKKSLRTSLPWLNFKTGHFVLRCEENIVEFLEGRFRNQKLSLVHKKETENLFEFSVTICVF